MADNEKPVRFYPAGRDKLPDAYNRVVTVVSDLSDSEGPLLIMQSPLSIQEIARGLLDTSHKTDEHEGTDLTIEQIETVLRMMEVARLAIFAPDTVEATD